MKLYNINILILFKISLLLILLLVISPSLLSQNKVCHLKLIGSDISIFRKQAKQIKRYHFNDEKTLNLKVEQLKSYYIEKGYLETNIDSIYKISDTLYAVFHIGKPYVWKDLNLVVDKPIGREYLAFNFKGSKGFYFKEGTDEQSVILDYYSNHGYPFATLSLSDIKIADGEIRGHCFLSPNQRVVWDSMLIKGDAQIHSKFIENHLGIKPGQVYCEEKFEAISQLISKLDFISEIKPSELELFDGVAKVHHYLKKQSANRFDGIIGFQNNNETDRLELTGEVNLDLVNSFHRGERIQFNWRKLEESSQNLKIDFHYPYIFNSKLGTDFSFQLMKQDSTYVNTNLRLGLNFQQTGNSGVRLFYQLKSSSLISSKHFAGLTVLPDFADSKSNLLGFQYEYEKLDRRYNPLKGWHWILDLSGGENKIKRNINIPDELYENIDLKTKIFEGTLSLKSYIPLGSKLVYHWQVMAAWMERVNYFENDLYRLGGMKSIRGFNEDSFRASKYALTRQEFQFVPSRNTSIYLFYDLAWYEQEIQEKIMSDHPMGYGFGLNFSAGSGMFTLNYALGKQNEESTDFKSAKIHFGFIVKF
ncbi:BamA/TamA family outer membrane protein [Ancylomarina sp.]|uniref:BamA/TamA family outer membrane protein n=1 Tax=Ancylomarina sp. TaxID=1970196 RepID=UPI0035616959